MLIGIDASRAVSPTPTGTEVYSRELIRALLALDRRNRYRLYTRERVEATFFCAEQQPDIRAIPFPRLWTHLRLSAEMIARPPDLLFVPAHVLPLVHPARSVVTVHDLGYLHFPEAHPPLQRWYHYWSTRWNVRAAWRVLADSEATRDDLAKFYRVAPEQVAVVYPAFDHERYRRDLDPVKVREVGARWHVEKDYILAIGTIHPRKNYARLIRAFAQLRNRDCQLIIAGKTGWMYREILDAAEKLGLSDRVRFLGFVPASDMPELIRGAKLLAFPSLHEGFGLPVLEAQACGTPVVCSMTSSLPEAAGDGALVVDPCDVDALSAAMARLLTDHQLRDRLVAHGLENVKRFSWEASARRVLQVMEACG